jgi:aspartate oxidase
MTVTENISLFVSLSEEESAIVSGGKRIQLSWSDLANLGIAAPFIVGDDGQIHLTDEQLQYGQQLLQS